MIAALQQSWSNCCAAPIPLLFSTLPTVFLLVVFFLVGAERRLDGRAIVDGFRIVVEVLELLDATLALCCSCAMCVQPGLWQ